MSNNNIYLRLSFFGYATILTSFVTVILFFINRYYLMGVYPPNEKEENNVFFLGISLLAMLVLTVIDTLRTFELRQRYPNKIFVDTFIYVIWFYIFFLSFFLLVYLERILLNHDEYRTWFFAYLTLLLVLVFLRIVFANKLRKIEAIHSYKLAANLLLFICFVFGLYQGGMFYFYYYKQGQSFANGKLLSAILSVFICIYFLIRRHFLKLKIYSLGHDINLEIEAKEGLNRNQEKINTEFKKSEMKNVIIGKILVTLVIMIIVFGLFSVLFKIFSINPIFIVVIAVITLLIGALILSAFIAIEKDDNSSGFNESLKLILEKIPGLGSFFKGWK